MSTTKTEILSNLDPSNPATIQALIDFHRETFGGWKMEGEEVEETEADAPETEEEPPEGDAPETETEEPGEESDDDADTPEGLDDRTKAYVSKLRGEAAGWRVQVRELQAKLDGAVTAEDLAKVKDDFAKELAAKDRELVLAEVKLPKELAARLVNGTREEMLADARSLAKFVAPPVEEEDDDLGGGLTPLDPESDHFDGAALARSIRNRRKGWIG